jgi:hypothetical protein
VSAISEATIGLLYQPWMMMSVKAIDGTLGKGNGNTRRKPAPMPLSQLQIPQDMIGTRTRAVASLLFAFYYEFQWKYPLTIFAFPVFPFRAKCFFNITFSLISVITLNEIHK